MAAVAAVEIQFPDREVINHFMNNLELDNGGNVEFYQLITETFQNTVWTERRDIVDKIYAMTVLFVGDEVEDYEDKRLTLGSCAYLFLLQSSGLMRNQPPQLNNMLAVNEFTVLHRRLSPGTCVFI